MKARDLIFLLYLLLYAHTDSGQPSFAQNPAKPADSLQVKEWRLHFRRSP